MEIKKKVKMTLVGFNWNAFAIMGTFQAHARKQWWEQKEIDYVLKEAKTADYSHLLYTILSYIEEWENMEA